MFDGPLMLQVNWPVVHTIHLLSIKQVCYEASGE